jgi:hypothetical protein
LDLEDAVAADFQAKLKAKLSESFHDFFDTPNFALIAAAFDVHYTPLRWCKASVIDQVWEVAAVQAKALAINDCFKLNTFRALLSDARKTLLEKHKALKSARKLAKAAGETSTQWPNPLEF